MVFKMFFLMTLFILSIVSAYNPIEISINNHRNQPFCEFVEAQPTSAILWSSLTQHDCPQPQWNDIKNQASQQYFIVDTRYITRDTTIIHFESSQLISDSFLNIQEFVGFDPNNILPFLRESELRGTPSVPAPFESFELAGFDVTYIWNAGEEIFILIETVGNIENYYILSSSTFINSLVPPMSGIIYENGFPNNNWRLQSIQIENDIINRGANGITHTPILIRDHFGNNFQLLTPLSCISCNINNDIPCYCDQDSSENSSSDDDVIALSEERDISGMRETDTDKGNIKLSESLILGILSSIGFLVIGGVVVYFCWLKRKKWKKVMTDVDDSNV
eukprot:428933_1